MGSVFIANTVDGGTHFYPSSQQLTLLSLPKLKVSVTSPYKRTYYVDLMLTCFVLDVSSLGNDKPLESKQFCVIILGPCQGHGLSVLANMANLLTLGHNTVLY